MNRHIIPLVCLKCIMCLLPLLCEAGNYKAKADSLASLIKGCDFDACAVQSINILKYGAVNDGTKDCLPAFRKAIANAEKKGGGHLYVPEGVYYLCGPLHLCDNLWIELAPGATLRFSPDPKCYLPAVETSWEGTFVYNYSPMIYGKGLKNVAITGQGTIDGNAASTFATWRQLQSTAQQRTRDMNHSHTPLVERVFGEGDYLRPQLLQMYGCDGVTLEGFKMVNSPFWCVHLLKSHDVVCRSLKYDTYMINNDGIDPEMSSMVLIEDIDFDNGDDNIGIKSGRDDDGWVSSQPSEDIVIRNCRFKGLHAVVLGSEMSGGIRSIYISDCTYGGYCKRGIYVKTNPDRGGYIHDIYVDDCEFGEVEDLFYITSRYAGEGLDNNHYSEIYNIYVDGLSGTHASGAALVIQGVDGYPVHDVYLDHIKTTSSTTGIDFTNTERVILNNSTIGKSTGVPTQVTEGCKNL